MDVVVKGEGSAAYCCAHLLARAGLPVVLERVDRRPLPAILLSEQSLALIRDVFERHDLFRDSHRISKRVVSWGPNAKAIAVEHSAVVVSEEELLAGLRPLVIAGGSLSQESRWTVFASHPLPDSAVEQRFGNRSASASPVTLNDQCDPAACLIESLEDGWLFLLPNAPRSGWLLAVGAAVGVLLGQSRLIAGHIAHIAAAPGKFPAHPRIVSPLGAPGWLACGTAALAFDPICGDGTAHAIREAILASAVIRSLAAGGSTSDLLLHYEARLMAGFRRHLDVCREFYGSAGPAGFWITELAEIQRGIQWCDSKLGAHPNFHYQLRGFELESVR